MNSLHSLRSTRYARSQSSATLTPAILAGDMNYNPGTPAFNTTDNQWTDLTNMASSEKNRANQIDCIFHRSDSDWNVETQSQFIRTPHYCCLVRYLSQHGCGEPRLRNNCETLGFRACWRDFSRQAQDEGELIYPSREA